MDNQFTPMTPNSSPRADLSRFVIPILAFLAGIALSVGGFFLFKNQLYVGTFAVSERAALSKVPACLPNDVKGAPDKDLLVYILQYDAAMSSQFTTLAGKLTNSSYKAIVNAEVSRIDKEQSAMKSAYKAALNEDYSPSLKSSLTEAIPIPAGINDNQDKGAISDADRIGNFYGLMQHIGTAYYTPAMLSQNPTIANNAVSFQQYYKDLVVKIYPPSTTIIKK